MTNIEIIFTSNDQEPTSSNVSPTTLTWSGPCNPWSNNHD